MNRLRALPLAFCSILLAALPVGAQVLLLNPGTLTGNSTLLGSAPYTVAGGRWNNGGFGSYGSSLVYSTMAEGDATGVNVVVTGNTVSLTGSGVTTTGTGTLNFGSPTGNNYVGSEAGSNFSNRPAIDAVYSNTSATTAGIMGMRVGGLNPGIYDIYVVGAYVGDATDASRPGNGSTSHAISVFGLVGDFDNTLDYTSAWGSGSATVDGGSTTSFNVLENSVNNAWTEGNTFAKLTLTITNSTDYVYIVASGDRTLHSNTRGTGNELRGWLNAVQIVAIPEPGVSAGLACGLGLIALTRRRRA